MRPVRILTVLMVLTAFAAYTSDAFAQKKPVSVEQLLDANGAQGTEFWIAVPPNELPGYTVSALEIYVACAVDTDVEIFDPETNQKRTKPVAAGQIRTLSTVTGETSWSWEIRQAEQVVRKAIRIRSPKPISVYVLNAKRFSADGYLAIPVQAWGTEYRSCSYFDFKEQIQGVGTFPWAGGFCIIASKDNTVVTVDLRGIGEDEARTSMGTKINTNIPITLSMNEGDIWMVHGDATTRAIFDLTGSSIRSSQPVGLLNFHMRTTMPNQLQNGNGRNHLIEMPPPVSAWGKRYVTLEYKRNHVNGQGKGDVFRVVASQPNTTWELKMYDPITKQLIGNDGGPLAKAGDFADRTQSTLPTNLPSGITVWTANKPIFVAQYSCSSSWDGDQNLDPFMINVTPEEQYISSTIFQTPTISNFSDHYLNLVVYSDTADPNYIENLKSLTLDDKPVWSHPDAAIPLLLFSRLPGTNSHFCTIKFGVLATSHRVTSNGKAKFGGYIYGFGATDAYGWPAAAGFGSVVLDTMPPVLIKDTSCGDFSFEATELRNIPNPPKSTPGDSDQVETGISNIAFVPTAPNDNYRIVLLTAQDFPRTPSRKNFGFRLEVIDRSRSAYAEIVVQDFGRNKLTGAVNTTFDTVSYVADSLAFSPINLSFGKRRVGAKRTLDVTVRNAQSKPILIDTLILRYGVMYHVLSGAIPPSITLAPNASHSFSIEYDATRDSTSAPPGMDIDTLIVTTECGDFRFPITGYALEPKIKVTDFDAGTASLGEIRCGTVKIENEGSDTLLVTAIQGYQGTKFSLSTPFTPALPFKVPPKTKGLNGSDGVNGSVTLQSACYQRSDVNSDDEDITFSSDAASGDSVSKWIGKTQSPGPNIIGYDWLKRRVNTVHQAFGQVYNTGTQALTLTDVTFEDGTRFYPPGSTSANCEFQIVGLFNNGQPVTSFNLRGDGTKKIDSIDVLVLFRPNAETPFVEPMYPVFDGVRSTTVTADLKGEGILPQISTIGWDASCSETVYGVPYTRSLTVTNLGTMPLTVSSIAFAAPNVDWTMVAPATPLLIPALGGTLSFPVTFTRAPGNDLASTATVNITHDAIAGNGVDSAFTSTGTASQIFRVGGCTGPDILVTDLPFGRQRANCDAPSIDFTITNTGGGLTPLEVREINPTGPDSASFVITAMTRTNGTAAVLPFTVAAGEVVRVSVLFTPTEPNAAPWSDRVYAAAFEVKNFVDGGSTEIRPGLVSTVTGVGYVVPVQFNLTNLMNPGETRNPGANVDFSVAASSAQWTPANITNLTVDVVYATRSLVYVPGQTTPAVTGWTVSEPTITTDAVDPSKSRMRFVLAGPAITANTNLFGFRTTLLLGNDFTSHQTIEVAPPRACIVVTTTGDSTAIFNCALVRRVVAISGTQTAMAPVAPNPVSDGTLSFDFGVGISALTTIDLVDAQGQVVRTLVDSKIDSGEYTLMAPTAGLPSGAYFLRMRTLDFVRTQRVVIVD